MGWADEAKQKKNNNWVFTPSQPQHTFPWTTVMAAKDYTSQDTPYSLDHSCQTSNWFCCKSLFQCLFIAKHYSFRYQMIWITWIIWTLPALDCVSGLLCFEWTVACFYILPGLATWPCTHLWIELKWCSWGWCPSQSSYIMLTLLTFSLLQFLESNKKKNPLGLNLDSWSIKWNWYR